MDDLPHCEMNNTYPAFQAMLRVYGNAPVIVGGLVTNLINMIIFRHACMRTSMLNWFLLALAVCDQMVLLCTFLMLSLPVITEQVGNLAWIELSTYLTRWTYPVGQISQTCSVYLTIMISLYRYLGVCHPFRAQRWFTSSTVKVAIGGTVMFGIALNMSRWFELKMVDCFSYVFNQSSVLMIPADLLQNEWYSKWYFVYGYTISMFVVPFATLIIANTFISIRVHKSHNLRRRMTKENIRQGSQRGSDTPRPPLTSLTSTSSTPLNGRRKSEVGLLNSKELNTTMMLLAIVVLFLVCNSLAFINNIIYFLKDSKDNIQTPAFTVLVEIGNILVTFNSASNFFIYVLFSSKYRALLRTFVLTACSPWTTSNEDVQMLYMHSTIHTGRSMSLISHKHANYTSRLTYRQSRKRNSSVKII